VLEGEGLFYAAGRWGSRDEEMLSTELDTKVSEPVDLHVKGSITSKHYLYRSALKEKACVTGTRIGMGCPRRA
jgi:hypothetical protein